MIEITEQQFKEKLANKESFILDFCADWCSHCREVALILPESVFKLDVDKCSTNLLDEYQVNELPVIVTFKDGKEVNRNV